MTKEQLIEMINHRVVRNQVGMDTTDFVSEQMIEAHLELAYDSVFNQIITKRLHNGLMDLNSYGKTYKGVEIKYDKERFEYYSDLPVKAAELVDNEAIRLISSNKDIRDAFFPRKLGAQSFIMGSLDVNNEGSSKYYLERDKVWYVDIDPDLEKVQMIIIPSVSEVGYDEELSLPAEGESIIVDMVVQMLVQKYNLPPDSVNDQNVL